MVTAARDAAPAFLPLHRLKEAEKLYDYFCERLNLEGNLTCGYRSLSGRNAYPGR
jgi:hypothetical protein